MEKYLWMIWTCLARILSFARPFPLTIVIEGDFGMVLEMESSKADHPVALEDMLSFSATENVTSLPHGAESSESDSLNPAYAVAIALGVGFFTVLLVASLVYRFVRKRSGPVWISKIAHMKDKYTTMTDEDTVFPRDNFIIGFSNPVVEATADTRDGGGGVTVIGYRPLEPDKDHLHCESSRKIHFPREKIVYGEEQGTGWFGKVYEGEAYRIQLGVKKTKVIIKQLREQADLLMKKYFLEETEMFSSVEHKNVITVLGQSAEKDPFLMLLEYTPLGSLKQFLLSHRNSLGRYQEGGMLVRMSVDMASGLDCLHYHKFFHRDFAARNCIVASDMSVKVGDYGISRSKFENDYYSPPSLSELPIPLRWLAPEDVAVNLNQGVTTKSPSEKGNVWSFGVTLWEVVEFGRQPYEELTNEEVLQSVVVDRLYQLPEPKQPGKTTQLLYDVMKQCWLEPHARPPMCDVTAALLNLTAVSWNSGENVTQADVTPTKGTSSLVPVKETSILNNYNKTADNLIETNDRQHEKTEPFSNTSAPSSRATINSFVGRNVVDISELNSEPNDIKNPHSPPVAIVRPLQLDRQGICSTSGFGSNIPPSPSNTKHDTENYIEETSTSTNLSECVCNPVDDVAYTPPPVTYIGDPTDSIELFRSRAHSDTAVSRLQRPLTRSQSTDSTTSQDSVSSTGSEYVMLPGETTRRRSSFRQANYQSGKKSVHYPANILALRTIHRYVPEPEEDECDSEPEETGEEDWSHDHPVFCDTKSQGKVEEGRGDENKEKLERDEGEENEAQAVKEPSSPVEKKIKKASRRQKLGKSDDEWTVTLEDPAERE